MELCRNLAHSLCDYERKKPRWPFKTTSDRHVANKVLITQSARQKFIRKIIQQKLPN